MMVVVVMMMAMGCVLGADLGSARDGSLKQCTSCEVFFTGVIKALGANATKEELKEEMEAECQREFGDKPADLADCEEFTEWVLGELPQLESLLEEYEPVGLCSILSLCVVDCCKKNSQPQQIMLAATGDPTQMAVTWVSPFSSSPAPAVRWWPASSPASVSTANGTSQTYVQGGWVGLISSAVVVGLTPGRVEYGYQVGDAATGQWSGKLSLVSWVQPGAPGSFVMMADLGLANSDGTVAGVQALTGNRSVDWVGTYGDLSYADAYQLVWDEQGRRLQPITSAVPYHVTTGNHEIPWNFVACRHRFSMPSAGWLSGEAKYYSLDFGLVHNVFLDSELATDLPNFGAKQVAWLKQDLALAQQQRGAVPWIVVGFHRPLYCSHGGPTDKNCNYFADLLKAEIEDVLFQYQVDLVLYGHVHAYERTWPVYHNLPTQFNYTSPTAPVYVMNGAAGNPEGNTNNYQPRPAPQQLVRRPQPSLWLWCHHRRQPFHSPLGILRWSSKPACFSR